MLYGKFFVFFWGGWIGEGGVVCGAGDPFRGSLLSLAHTRGRR